MVTFFPRMSSTLTSFFLLRRSSWYSNGRLISSRALMPWNSRTSSPSGVTISITLAMTSLGIEAHPIRRARFENSFNRRGLTPPPYNTRGLITPASKAPYRHIRNRRHGLSFGAPILARADDQTGDGNPGLHPKLRVSDFRRQLVCGQQLLHIRLRVRVPTMRLEMIVGRAGG